MFNTIDLANKSLDYLLQRQEALSKNVANVDTPGYKRVDVKFKTSLEEAIKKQQVNLVETEVFTDNESYSYRLDGNNVDIDKEMAEISLVSVQYNTIVQCQSSQFNKYRTLLQSV